MKSFVYLLKKGDLYLIGQSKDIEKLKKTIKPDEIIATKVLKQAASLEARLFRRYRNERLPGSDYFKLSDKQAKDCIKQLGKRSQIPKTISAEYSISFTGSLLLFLLAVFAFNYLKVPIRSCIAIGFFFASVPFWLLLFLGNFGGYETNDLPLFASWSNRVKALITAALLTFLAYIIHFPLLF